MDLDYKPGLHILSTMLASAKALQDLDAYRRFLQLKINEYGLNLLGEIYHRFEGEDSGFTACIGLSESHLSIHTWPEFGHFTFDVYLSNCKRDNSAIVSSLYEDVRQFFDADVVSKHEIYR